MEIAAHEEVGASVSGPPAPARAADGGGLSQLPKLFVAARADKVEGSTSTAAAGGQQWPDSFLGVLQSISGAENSFRVAD